MLAPSTLLQPTTTPLVYTLSLHDALPILSGRACSRNTSWSVTMSRTEPSELAERGRRVLVLEADAIRRVAERLGPRSEEHTSELQSRRDLVCRLLLEKKKCSGDRSPPEMR